MGRRASGAGRSSHARYFTGGAALLGIPGFRPMGAPGAVSVIGNNILYEPFTVDTTITVDQLVVEVTTAVASAGIRIGLCKLDPQTGQPIGDALLDSGELSAATTGVKTYTPATPVVLPPGRYAAVAWMTLNIGVRTVVGTSGDPGIVPTLGANLYMHGWLWVVQAYANTPFASPLPAWTNLAGSSTISRVVFLRYSAVA